LQSIVDAVRYKPFALATLSALALACMTQNADADRVVAGTAKAASAEDLVVERGDRGSAIRSIQRALGVPADGVFGPQTERAVKHFQRRKGLLVDGVVGPQTRAALGLAPFARTSVRRGRSPRRSDVRVPRILRLIAECESGGDPRAISPGGDYRGKYQFSRGTWRGLGGEGDPADASEAEQDRLALKLYRRSGNAPWPNCP
jgi:Transglycosylase-like domain/Putative peptidoglycan binding domain